MGMRRGILASVETKFFLISIILLLCTATKVNPMVLTEVSLGSASKEVSTQLCHAGSNPTCNGMQLL